MNLDGAIAKRDQLLAQGGKTALNIKYPNEFELYLIAFELTDESGKTLRYFIFPIMPSSLEENETQLTNVKKTLAGVTELSTTTFVPNDINLSGNFGRSFKILLGDTAQDLVSSFQDAGGNATPQSLLSGAGQFFDSRVKTGYGCLKVLEDIINQSNQIGDDGQLRKLIFHNLAFGNSYLVKVMDFKITESEQVNMVPGYSLRIRTIAPLASLQNKKDLQNGRQTLAITGFIQMRVDSLLNSLTSIIGN